jgi:hypothetical protein
MTILGEATALYAGDQPVQAVYVGATKVWPDSFNPSDITGLAVWLDAADYVSGVWTNRGSGAQPGFIGSPAPVVSTNTLNGKSVVRFTRNEGRLRMLSGSGANLEWTLVYVGRMVGPSTGRVVTAVFPPSNMLVGFWNGNQDVLYDAGFADNSYVGWTTDWKMYGGDCTNYVTRLFSDGVLLGSTTTGTANGWQDTFSISGFDPVADNETCDCEVAEAVLYNRKLSDVERQKVEGYLRDKWFKPPYDPDTNAYLVATGLDVSFAPALDGLVTGLKDAGLWSKMLAVYPFIGGTEALHKWNLKDPRDLDAAYRLTFLNNVTGTHSTALGYRPNAQGMQLNGGYADSHITPRGIFDQNSTSLAYYSLAEVPPISRCEMGCYNWDGDTANRFHIIARYTGGLFYYGMAEHGVTGTPVPASTGLFVATRTGPNTQSGYRNGALVQTTNMPSIWLPNVPIWVGGINVFQDRSDLPCGFASVGVGLSATDNDALNLVVTDYQDALGRRPAFTGFW